MCIIKKIPYFYKIIYDEVVSFYDETHSKWLDLRILILKIISMIKMDLIYIILKLKINYYFKLRRE